MADEFYPAIYVSMMKLCYYLLWIPASCKVNAMRHEVMVALFWHLALKRLQKLSKPLKSMHIWADPKKVNMLQWHIAFWITVYIPEKKNSIRELLIREINFCSSTFCILIQIFQLTIKFYSFEVSCSSAE